MIKTRFARLYELAVFMNLYIKNHDGFAVSEETVLQEMSKDAISERDVRLLIDQSADHVPQRQQTLVYVDSLLLGLAHRPALVQSLAARQVDQVQFAHLKVPLLQILAYINIIGFIIYYLF